MRVVGGAGGRAGVVRAARRRAGVGPARARAAPQAARAPRAHQVRGAVAARGLLRHRRRRRGHQGRFHIVTELIMAIFIFSYF